MKPRVKPVQYHININERPFRFQMNFDPEFIPDRALHRMFKEGDIPEREVLSLMFNVLRPGDVAFDVGANVGMFSLFMTQLVAPGGKILAFEPSRINYEKLKANMKLNNADVWIHPWALSDKKEEVAFYEAEDTGQSALRPLVLGQEVSYQVTATCLDTFFLDYMPKLIKLDCEGAELAILQGGEKMLERGVPFVVCEIADQNLQRFGTDQFELRSYMHGIGYSCWLIRPDGELPTYIPYATALRSEILNLNVLFATEKTVTSTWQHIDVKAV